MSKKIIEPTKLENLAQQLHSQKAHIVLAGGCFDVLHEGHLAFLQKSKEQGDILILLLEADARIKQLKGENRPVNTQLQRAKVLAKLPTVDYIFLLPGEMTNGKYDELILLLKPAIITATNGDPYRIHKDRQAKLVGAQVKTVIDRLPHVSTTKLLEQTL